MPGSPYLFGLGKSGSDIDTFPPEAFPVLGIGRDSRGYTLLQVCEMTLTYSVEYGLTEEAVVSKLRTSGAHLRFVHQHESLRDTKDGEGLITWRRQLQVCYSTSSDIILFLRYFFCADMSRWGRYGPGGQLWAEVHGREHEWYGGDVIDRLLQKVTAPMANV